MEPVLYEKQQSIAVLRLNNPPVNALSHALRHAIAEAFDRAEEDTCVRAVLIVGEGRAFVAGADIKEFGKPLREPMLPWLCSRIESSPLLVVASMHGVSLGGGLELALACHYRIAQPDARVGLPEVHLGLIPGAGGTQRLPRLTGADEAIEAITTGRHILAPEAKNLGILDRIERGVPLEVGLAYAQELLDAKAPRRPICEMPSPAATDWNDRYASILQRSRGQLSPAAAVRAIQASAELSFGDGLAEERRIFDDLMQTDQRKGLIHTFFEQRKVSQVPEAAEASPRRLEKLGVVGGGTMGSGIATAALLGGFDVTLVEQDNLSAERARARIQENLQSAVKRGKLTETELVACLAAQLTCKSGYDALREVDLVIEAVFEDMALKKTVFARLEEVCKPDAILATNTSYLDINELAAATGRPCDVLGLHFFSPAHVMKLLEVVVADATTPDVVASGFALAKRLGKIAVRAGVCDGFIGNRMMQAYRTVSDNMVLDGASPFEIDAAIEAFGFAMGPFKVSDLAGLDIGWAARKRRGPTLNARARVGTYADALCEAGHFGRKTGKGFYLYPDGSENPKVAALIDADRTTRDITPRTFSAEEIQNRFLAAMVNEGAMILGEGIARRPADIDMAMVFGYGFPKYWGGPMKWADLSGTDEVLVMIERFAQEDDFFWRPAPLLRDLVKNGQTFDALN